MIFFETIKQKLNDDQLERWLFVGILVGLFIPLSTNIGFLVLYVWNIPAFFLLGLTLFRRVYLKNYEIEQWDAWDYSIGGMIVWLLVATLLGEDVMSNFSHYLQFCLILCLALYCRRVWGGVITTRTLILFSFVGILIQSAIGMLQQATFSQIGNPKAFFGEEQSEALRDAFGIQLSRVQGTLGHPNLVGNWLITLFPFVFISTRVNAFETSQTWLYKRIVLLVGILGLVFTLSRGNIGFFLILCIIYGVPFMYYFLDIKWDLTLDIKRILFLLVLLAGVGYWLSQNTDKIELVQTAIEMRMDESLQGSSSQGSANFRMEMNRGALQKIAENPVLGIGFLNSRYIWPTVDTAIPTWWTYRPHNVYLMFGVEGGIPVFLFFIVITILPMFHLFISIKPISPLRLAFLFALTAGFFASQIYLTTVTAEYGALYFLLIGCAMGYYDKYKEDRKGFVVKIKRDAADA